MLITAHENPGSDHVGSLASPPLSYELPTGLRLLSNKLLDCITRGEVVDAVVDVGVTILGARAGLVAVLSEDGACLDVVRDSRQPDQLFDDWRRCSIATPLPLSDAVRENRILLFSGRDDWCARYPEMAEKIASGDFKASATLPLSARGSVFGALHFSLTVERDFTPIEVEQLTDMARVCALALDRALLLERTERALQESETGNKRVEFLARAGSLLGESLDYRSRLEALARLCVPELCDWAAVEVMDEDGHLMRLGVAHRLPELEPVMREVQRRYPPRRDRGASSLTVLETGKPLFYENITEEMIDRGAESDEHALLLKRVGIRDVLCLPIQARGNTLGVLVLGMAPMPQGSDRRLTGEIRSLAEDVARRAGIAVDNARLYGLAQRESAEREAAHRRTAAVLESIGEMFFAVDSQFNLTYVNRHTLTRWNMQRECLIGRNVWELFPQVVGSELQQAQVKAMQERQVVRLEGISQLNGRWIDLSAFPSEDGGLSVYYRDTHDRKTAELELQTRVEQEALLSQIAQEVRTAVEPDAVQASAVTLLGKYLHADRCYYAVYDAVRDLIRCYRDHHSVTLSSIEGEYQLSSYRELVDHMLSDGTSVVNDTRNELPAHLAAILIAHNSRALIAVPLFSGSEFVAALFVMVSEPRTWTRDEVKLVEQVATITRSALETAKIAYKEHAVAERLQAALQPAIPSRVPGLDLAHHYRPALDEAEVGGDFADVFPRGKGATYLVVGDMAGKGLAAASQVAMVRNILRYALLNAATVSEGVENANRTIAAHEMLLGFATLFVACYDAQSQLLSYVNYGQEAGVLIRASDTVIEALPATGPVFGLLNMGSVPEVTVSLHTGDVVAVFTDGLTEIGPSRKEMLENAGMARIIASYSRLSSPKEILAHAISDVTEFARGIVRDDQCLLIALATD